MRSSSLSNTTSNVCSVADEFVARASDCLAQACHAILGDRADFSDVETILYACANEAVRQQLESRLKQVANEHGDRIVVDGKRYQRHQDGEIEYHTLVGAVRVRRATYREVGVRNGPTIVPLELAAGLIHRASPALAYSIAHGYGAGPIRHYEAQVQAAQRSLPPHATVERLARRIGGSAARNVVRIEADVRREEPMPPGAHAIAVSLDRTSVAMAEERPPMVAPNGVRRKRRKPLQRRPPHPFDVHWRMIYVGTVSIVDENGEAITTRKYHATPEEETDEIVGRMMADVAHCRAQAAMPVVVVQDGAPEMWNVLRPALRHAKVERWTEVLDRYHANEHIAAALEVIEPDRERRQRRYAQWKRQLDRSPRAIYRIAKWLRSKWWELPNGTEKSRTVGSHTGYLTGYARMMNYAAYRRAGLPTASGPVEGACKSLVAARCKRSGQRWKQDGLTAALTLRALDHSDRLIPFWRRFCNEFRATIMPA